MTDQPGNAEEPQAPATQWAPPPPPPAAPVVDSSQWAPPPPPPPDYDPAAAYPPPPAFPGAMPAAGRSRGILLPIVAILLAIALAGVGGFSYVTVTGLNKDLDTAKASLAAEQSAHKAASDKADAQGKCAAALKADETALVALNTKISAVQARLLSKGDFDTARTTYEAALVKALGDFDQSWVDALAAKNSTESAAALDSAIAAEREMNAAKALKTAMDSLGTTIASDSADAVTTLASLNKQMAATATTCAAVPS